LDGSQIATMEFPSGPILSVDLTRAVGLVTGCAAGCDLGAAAEMEHALVIDGELHDLGVPLTVVGPRQEVVAV
jgi:hypothetical protein